jgi:biopolymer transport protein TolR
LTQGIEVELPKAGAEPIDTVENTDPLVLSVDSAGNLYLNVGDDESSPVDAERIMSLTSVVLERRPNTPVLVKADFRVAYGEVVAAMVLLQRAGAEKIGFLTDPADFKKLEAG